MYSGPIPNENVRKDLNMKSFECFKDQSTSYINAVVVTNGKYRPSNFRDKFELINKSRTSEENKFILRKQSEVDDEIMTLERLDKIGSLKQHGFYQRVQDAKNHGDPSYYKWPNTEEQIRERDLIKELHIDMAKPSGKNQKKTSAYSFDSDDDEGAAGAAGGVEASPETPVRPRSQLGLRKKRMAYRIYEDDEDDVGAAAGAGSGSAQAPALPATAAEPVPASAPLVAAPALLAAAAEPVPASAPPVAAPALPAALAEPVPAPAPPAAQMDARILAIEKKLADLEETNSVLTSNEAVYQIAYNTIEARLREKDEKHAELMKEKDEKHVELMKMKDDTYLEIIKGTTDCFKRLMDEKDEKYTHVYEMVGHLENAYKRSRSSS